MDRLKTTALSRDTARVDSSPPAFDPGARLPQAPESLRREVSPRLLDDKVLAAFAYNTPLVV